MSIVSEFKEFAMKGNVVDLAVGVIIGAAFGKIVDSLVKDLIMPVVGRIIGGLDFSSYFILLANPQKVPAKNVKEFVDWTRQQKGLFMATFGAGTPGHFGAYMFGDAIGIKPEPVHYKTTGDAMTGIYGGDVAGVFASAGLAAPAFG